MADEQQMYRWYRWTREEVVSFLAGIGYELDETNLHEWKDHWHVDVMPEDKFMEGSFETMFAGRDYAPDGFDPVDDAEARPVAFRMGLLSGSDKSVKMEGEPEDDTIDVSAIEEEVNLHVTEEMVSSAKRGLYWREEHGRGGSLQGVARANEIVRQRSLTEAQWKKLYKFYKTRIEKGDQDKGGWNMDEAGYPSSRRIAWELRGGDAGYSRAAQVMQALGHHDETKSVDQEVDADAVSLQKAKGEYGIQALAFFHGMESIGGEPDGFEASGSADPAEQESEEEMEEKSPSIVMPASARSLKMSVGDSANELVLSNVLERSTDSSKFGYGITTAAAYAGPIVRCSEDDGCSWQAHARDMYRGLDASYLKSAESRLVYSNEDMVIKEADSGSKELHKAFVKAACKRYKVSVTDREMDEMKLDKALLVFENVVTTPRKDRDQDYLLTEGAEVDPKMPLLWQHVQVQPIGKMLKVLHHDKNSLVVLSAIMDVNQLAEDCAKMVEAGMLRISHGFQALEAVAYESDEVPEKGVMTPMPGLEIRRFEVMEESVVSVPSNVDAVITMYSRNELQDPLAKSWAKQFYSARPVHTCGCSFESEDASEKAAPDELKVGDFVEWNTRGSKARGKIEKIERDGRMPVPNEDMVFVGTPDNPAALIRIYRGGRPADVRVVQKFSSLTKIDKPPVEDEKEDDDKSVDVENKDVDLSVTAGMIEEAKKALEWREEFGRGGTNIGAGRARQIVNDKKLSPDTWRRVKSYFARHEKDKEAEGFRPGEEGFPSAGRIAWGLWGGDAGQSRSKVVVGALDREEERKQYDPFEQDGPADSAKPEDKLDEENTDDGKFAASDVERQNGSGGCSCQGSPKSIKAIADDFVSQMIVAGVDDLGVLAKTQVLLERTVKSLRDRLLEKYK